jgi:hypothetical protein
MKTIDMEVLLLYGKIFIEPKNPKAYEQFLILAERLNPEAYAQYCADFAPKSS